MLYRLWLRSEKWQILLYNVPLFFLIRNGSFNAISLMCFSGMKQGRWSHMKVYLKNVSKCTLLKKRSNFIPRCPNFLNYNTYWSVLISSTCMTVLFYMNDCWHVVNLRAELHKLTEQAACHQGPQPVKHSVNNYDMEEFMEGIFVLTALLPLDIISLFSN